MASHFENLLSCGICLDFYDQPKRLRDCPHVFCQKCLEPLVTDDSVLNCPTCRAKNTLPGGKVERLHTDLQLQEMVESFLCVDCKTIDRFAKECDGCHVRSCHLCICSHDSAEKCALLGSIRKLKSSLPATRRLQEKRAEWVALKEMNLVQKKRVDQDMTELIEALQEKKKCLLEKFDELDNYADSYITPIDETTKMNDSLQELKNVVTNMTVEALSDAQNSLKKNKEWVLEVEQMLVESPPDALGTIYTGTFKQEINNIGILITRRLAVGDQEHDVVFSVKDAQVRTRVESGWPITTLATGKLQISRHKGGLYDISIIDGENSVTKWTWSNCNPTMPKLQYGDWWYHIPWSLKDAENKVVYYTARITDREKRQLFASVMEQLEHRF